jgi:hypothetical protein
LSEDEYYEEIGKDETEAKVTSLEVNQTNIYLKIDRLEERVVKLEEKLDAFIERVLVELIKLEESKVREN